MSTVPKISSSDAQLCNQNAQTRHRRQRSFLTQVSQMSDEDILNASIKNANEKAKNSTAARVLEKGPYLVYAATSIVCGALAKGKLSNKLAATAGSLALFGVLNAASTPVDKAVSSVMNIGAKDTDRSEEHPILNSILNIAALSGIGIAAVKGVGAGTKKLVEKFTPTAQEIGTKLADSAKKLDNSLIGSKVAELSKKTSEIAKKHPKVSSFVKQTALYAPIVGAMGASIPLSSKVINDRNEIAMENAAKLSICRDSASRELELGSKLDENA